MGNLTKEQKDEMWRCHFIEYEIKVFDEQHTADGTLIPINFDSENFQAMLKSRVKWVDLLRSKGWTDEQIDDGIMRLYKAWRNPITAHNLLQAEASPSAKNNRLKDTAEFRARLMRDRVTKVAGKGYVSQMSKLPVKHTPKPPKEEVTNDWL